MLLQHDVGTALIIALIMFGMFCSSAPRCGYWPWASGVVGVAGHRPRRMTRIFAFLDPTAAPATSR